MGQHNPNRWHLSVWNESAGIILGAIASYSLATPYIYAFASSITTKHTSFPSAQASFWENIRTRHAPNLLATAVPPRAIASASTDTFHPAGPTPHLSLTTFLP